MHMRKNYLTSHALKGEYKNVEGYAVWDRAMALVWTANENTTNNGVFYSIKFLVIKL